MSADPLQIDRVGDLPAGLDGLVEASLAEGFGFVQRLADDWASDANRFEADGEAFFAAHRGGALVGVCGLNRDPFADDSRCGRLRRLYVLPSARRGGVARRLTDRAIAAAAGSFDRVRLRTHNPQADAFYRALGFRVVADDPRATHEIEVRTL